MLQELSFRIVGIVPLLMHNGQLANPLNKWSKAIKAITGKRKKTDEDHVEIARLEFMGGLYLNEEGAPCIPWANLKGCLVEGAKKQKKGEQFKAGCSQAAFDWPLLYDGPKEAEAMWASEQFADIRRAGLRGASVMRCRPYFSKWSCNFRMKYNPTILDERDIRQALETAGEQCGLCDFTPEFGLFIVE